MQLKLLFQGPDFPQRASGQEGETTQGLGLKSLMTERQLCMEGVEEAREGMSGACQIHQGALGLMLYGCISPEGCLSLALLVWMPGEEGLNFLAKHLLLTEVSSEKGVSEPQQGSYNQRVAPCLGRGSWKDNSIFSCHILNLWNPFFPQVNVAWTQTPTS